MSWSKVFGSDVGVGFKAVVIGLVVFVVLGARCVVLGFLAGTSGPMDVVLAKACTDAGACPLDVILLNGQVFPRTSGATIEKIQTLLDKTPTLNTVCFSSPGGSNEDASEISRYISTKGLNTCMAQIYLKLDNSPLLTGKAACLSMCPWMLLAGRTRTVLSKSVEVGFHGSSGNLRFCGCVWHGGPDLQAKEALAKLIRSNSEDRGDSEAVLNKHLALLDWSFEQGFGQTKARPVKDLLETDYFFTSDKSGA